MIGNQEFGDLLPGERSLAEDLQIGRDTLRAALEILEIDGWISLREHGKRRKIIKRPSSVAPGPARILRIAFLSPKRLEHLSPEMLLEIDHMRVLLGKQGYELIVTTPGLFHLRNPDRKLEAHFNETKAVAWILYQCPPPIQNWFEKQNVPVLVRGYPQPGISLPSIDEDWKAAAFHAGGTFRRNGHEQIGLLMPDAPLAGLRATEAGLIEALEGGGTIHQLIEKRDPGSLNNLLERTFKLKSPPTALIVTRSRFVLTVQGWLAERRLKVPDDLSIIALCYDSWFEHIIPSVTHYRLDSQTLARSVTRKLLQIISGVPSAKTSTYLIPECIVGKSVTKLT